MAKRVKLHGSPDNRPAPLNLASEMAKAQAIGRLIARGLPLPFVDISEVTAAGSMEAFEEELSGSLRRAVLLAAVVRRREEGGDPMRLVVEARMSTRRPARRDMGALKRRLIIDRAWTDEVAMRVASREISNGKWAPRASAAYSADKLPIPLVRDIGATWVFAAKNAGCTPTALATTNEWRAKWLSRSLSVATWAALTHHDLAFEHANIRPLRESFADAIVSSQPRERRWNDDDWAEVMQNALREFRSASVRNKAFTPESRQARLLSRVAKHLFE